MLVVHGYGTLLDVRSPDHLVYGRDPRIASSATLVGWVNAWEDYQGTPSFEAFYASPCRRRPRDRVKFADHAGAVQWIAGAFGAELPGRPEARSS